MIEVESAFARISKWKEEDPKVAINGSPLKSRKEPTLLSDFWFLIITYNNTSTEQNST